MCNEYTALGIIHQFILRHALVAQPDLVPAEDGEWIGAACCKCLPSLCVIHPWVRGRISAGNSCHMHLGFACQ